MPTNNASIRFVKDKYEKVFFPVTHQRAVVDSDGTNLETALAGKQDALVSGTSIKTINGSSILGSGNIEVQTEITMDNTPTSGSDNPVKSGGLFTALAAKQNNLTFDNAPTASSNNPVKSGGVYSALAEKVGSDDIDSVVELTKAQYDALATKDARTMYIISDTTIASDHIGVASLVQTTTSTEDGGTNVWTCTLTNGQTFTLEVKNGNQGNSGYSGAAEELEVVNNVTQGGATAALSAEMGKQLEGEISQLGHKVGEPASPNLFAIIDEGAFLNASGVRATNSSYNSCLLKLEPGATYQFIQQAPTPGGGNYVRIFKEKAGGGYTQVQAVQGKTPVLYTCPNDGETYYGQVVVNILPSYASPDPEIYKVNTSLEYRTNSLITSRNSLKILFIANSHARDAFSYMPAILEEIVPGIDVRIGILYKGSATLHNHYDYINNGTSYEAYDKYTSLARMWTTTTEATETTIDSALADETWDFIILQQRSVICGDYSTYQPYANDIITLLYDKLSHPIAIGWNMTYAVADDYSGNPESSSDALYAKIVAATQSLLQDSPFQFVIPTATAIQNARQTSLKSLGTFGDMTYDGLHLQEGIPCMVGAYSGALTFLSLMGMQNKGILGSQFQAIDAFLRSEAIPQQHGASVGVTDANCLLAQRSAMFAQMRPFELTTL